MAYTPGPWTREQMRVMSGDVSIATVGFTNNQAKTWPTKEDAEENLALILRAPAMAEAVVAADAMSVTADGYTRVPAKLWEAILEAAGAT